MGLYKVTVATGSDFTAGTIDTIAISLVGVNGESTKQELSHLWVPGKVSYFDVTTDTDLGDLLLVRIYKDAYLFYTEDAWYCLNVTVTSPEGRLYQFPLYHWISGVTTVEIPEGKAMISAQNLHPVLQRQRETELKKRNKTHGWKLFSDGAPHCMDVESVIDLPVNDQFSFMKRGGFSYMALLTKLAVKLKGLLRREKSWTKLEDMKMVFCFVRSRISGQVSQIWNEDSFFGYQYLNGVNPGLIRKCEKLSENFPVSNSMVAASLGTSTDLTEELKNGNIFLADYKILQGIPANPSINGKKQYIAAPLCLLWKDPKDQLLPIAIQLGQTPGEQNPIFLPSDSEWDWTLAKIWVRSSDFQVHQIIYHLLHTHLIAEVFNVATTRQLPMSHPVYKLIAPHLRYTLEINTISRTELLGPGGITDQILAIGNGGVPVLMKKAMEMVTYSDLCLPDDITSRGMDTIPNYYYRDDGLSVWAAVEGFVSSIVQFYYGSDEAVQTDRELQAWVSEIYEKGFQERESSGIPSSLDTVPSLVKYLTMVIFRCSVQHAAVNSGQFDFYSWLPNGPSSMKRPPPTAKGVTTLLSILDALPDVSTSTLMMTVMWQVSNEPMDKRRLGDYPEERFTEEAPKKFIAEFQKMLVEISQSIEEKNRSRRLPYPYLDPRRIENSISI
ncbi:hydroperoxide isomerase ALOXE3-like [Hyla sarda]|uniref:hydroperoxide isomerase ALOXE3-like n=1 Tax=Hyla sarda TaxID=327740 RepID=UPI0024C306FA|nr:hydroperoxide isomerase ALOXE3-like [Hyla sarda]